MVFLRGPSEADPGSRIRCREEGSQSAEMLPRCVKPQRLLVCRLKWHTEYRLPLGLCRAIALHIVTSLGRLMNQWFGGHWSVVGDRCNYVWGCCYFLWDKLEINNSEEELRYSRLEDLSQINNRLFNKQ